MRIPIRFTLPFVCLLLTQQRLIAQVVCEPIFPTVDDNVTIYYDATKGNGALTGISPVYAHMGVITTQSTSPTDWKHVVTSPWGTNNATSAMVNVSPNNWSKTFNIRSFFNIAANETVLKLAFVFRNAAGTVVGRAFDGADIYYDVYPVNGPLQSLLISPSLPFFLKNLGEQIDVSGEASKSATISLFDNGNLITSTSNTISFQHYLSVNTAGLHRVELISVAGNERDTVGFSYLVPTAIQVQDPPPGTELGITELTPGSVRLALYAPGKQAVHVIGDFNNWTPDPAYQLRRSVDGNTWWMDVSPVPAGQPVRFQYLVDGTLRIADPLSTLILDPWNDPFIPAITYPNLPGYPTGLTNGFVSVFQTNQAPFQWQATNYQRPDQSKIVVYELLMRDFIERHDYQTLLDTLDYLDQLGVNAIELMPVSEFDGNINWGYGPAFHKALDKYYGSAEALQRLVDACHQRNIAVILDVVFNQATGASPLAQLYWDNANNRPAANNPWLNPIAKHDFNVFNDFNHESLATKTYVKNCLKYWMNTFRVDGFRFDLSKGFTQKNTLGNTGAWGVYDASRVAIWKDYANFMWAIDPDFYVILEHFADNAEEKELANYGMMLWGNMRGAYKDLGLGFSSSADLSWVNYKQRGWNDPHAIGYMESHDEERIALELKQGGNNLPNYPIKTLPISMQRMEMLNNLLFTVPGPKMLWQFGELGYDFSINYCSNGSINTLCRTDPKPIRWDYFSNPYRRHLYDATAALLQLRRAHEVFSTSDYQLNIGSGQVRSIFLNDSDLNVAVFVNVGTSATTVSNPAFQHTGEWYEYYSGDTLFVGSGVPTTIELDAGAYHLYLDKVVSLPPYVQLPVAPEPVGAVEFMAIQPNPVQSELWVNFSLSQKADISLEIRDITGKTVETLGFDKLPEGEQLVEIDASNWAPGIYFVVLREALGGVLTKKILKY
jgi:glycosidase